MESVQTLQHNWYRDCVGFLVQENDRGERKAQGTAFFVRVKLEGWNHFEIYLATARHNLEYANRSKPLYLRFNAERRTASSRFYKDILIPLSGELWLKHCEQDVAVLPVRLEPTMFAGCVPHDMLLSKQQMVFHPPESGSPVVIATLFSKYYGHKQIEPILRFGNISLLPEDKMLVARPGFSDTEMDVYLIECLSWGGSSGAPVFVPNYMNPSQVSREMIGPMKLLGLIHGHCDEFREIKIGEQERYRIPNNAGISIVMPAQGILDLLFEQSECDWRQKVLDQLNLDGTVPEHKTHLKYSD